MAWRHRQARSSSWSMPGASARRGPGTQLWRFEELRRRQPRVGTDGRREQGDGGDAAVVCRSARRETRRWCCRGGTGAELESWRRRGAFGPPAILRQSEGPTVAQTSRWISNMFLVSFRTGSHRHFVIHTHGHLHSVAAFLRPLLVPL
eukprot:scaffold349_cov244-Pinguiococcus_pyrenoidosus.AAC.3